MRKTLLLCAATLLLMGCKSTSTETSTSEAAKAINANCVMQQDRAVDPDVTVTFEGTTVGFCCNKCAGKFETMTTEDKQAAVAKAK